MKREEYAAKLCQELDAVRVSPALRQRTIAALREKEGTIVKKKATTALIIALIILLLGSVALAAASRWGLVDFAGLSAVPHHVPANAPDYIRRNVAAWETETLSIAMREMYYDGHCLQAVVDVKPRDPGTLLVSGMYSTNDYYVNLLPDVTTEEDSRTIAQFFREGGYGKLLVVLPTVTTDGDLSQDCFLQEDGTLTFCLEAGYREPLAVRDAELRLLVMTCTDPSRDRMDRALDERLTFPLILTIPESVVPTIFVCDVPQTFPGVGVRIDRLTVTALPLSLYATVAYTVVDRGRYAAVEDALWFEFIDPDRPVASPVLQRLDGGFSVAGGTVELGDGRFVQFETLGVNEMRSVYTLRAFDAWTKERFDSGDFMMHEAAGE